MPLHLTQLDCGLLVEGVYNLSLEQTLDCGQCFTFSECPTADCLPEIEQTWRGISGQHLLPVSQRKDGTLLFHNTSRQTFEQVWKPFFDLDTDYAQIQAELSRDDILKQAVLYAPGIRILRQNGWEALCCFIISQNNNIKRIKGIVERLCQSFGQPLGEGCFSFPSPDALAGLSPEDLAVLRCGFRAKYLIDAARKVSLREIDFENLGTLPLEQAKKELMKIYGVGPKVADCALLYGFYRLECCPTDVWMKRVFSALYPNGLPKCAENYIGIAQQYLFHYARSCPQILEETPPQRQEAAV